MSVVSIPSGLILRPVREGFVITPPATQESEVDVGAGKGRPRTTGRTESARASFRMPRARYADVFEPWWRVDLAQGSRWFAWTHPLTGAAVHARILGQPGWQVSVINGGRVQIACEMRIRPESLG
jgi:hypothetical protein